MQILCHDERTIDFRFCLAGIGHEFFHAAIHTAIDIGIIILFGPFILYRTTFLHWLHPIICTLEINTVSGFIPQWPDDDDRMVLGTLIHTLGTIHVGRQPSGIFSQWSRSIPHAMWFNISFIYHIKSITITKLIPIRMGRIVRIADRIDIMLFHQFDIFFHQFLAYSPS